MLDRIAALNIPLAITNQINEKNVIQSRSDPPIKNFLSRYSKIWGARP